ncbi:MAG: DUF3551 domain-containing protein [Variibacter sp.]|nr:DUF3551 domain-containing protein [Variibacter sp.]
MRKTFLFAAVAAAAIGLAAAAQEAYAGRDYPYCAVAGGRNAYENCGYYTLAQCLAAVSGVGGHCMENPRYFANHPYAGRYEDAPRSHRRTR